MPRWSSGRHSLSLKRCPYVSSRLQKIFLNIFSLLIASATASLVEWLHIQHLQGKRQSISPSWKFGSFMAEFICGS